jgi:nicotinate-nucleotide adenylyltransferase
MTQKREKLRARRNFESRGGNLKAKMAATHGAKTAGGRRIALFGGTFDPIHSGHVAVARAAERHFHLDCVFFIPSSRPPHKPGTELCAYEHRFAMVALACSEHPRFVPSLAEAGVNGASRRVFYSIDTVRRFRQQFNRPGDRIYFIVGADSFLHLQTWKDYAELLQLCDFVVANRPGFHIRRLREVIPPALLAPSAAKESRNSRVIHLLSTSVYLLETVASHVSATDVRQRIERGQRVHGLVPPRVEEYITKQALYRQALYT